jgi:hypothetical protein
MQEAHMGMHTALSLPQSAKPDAKPTEASYISASPDLAGQLDVLKFDVTNILDEHGIKAKGAIEGGADEFSSGLDRLFSEADTQDLIETNQGLYAATLEQELFLILKNYEEAMNKPTFSGEEMEIYFEKPKVMISDKETLENIKLREELGLILDHEKHQIINPNLSEKEAMKRVELIKAQQKARMSELMPTEGEEDSEELDDEGKPIPKKEEIIKDE